MGEEEKRLHRCCFTGHRPEKLTVSEEEVLAGLRREIQRAVEDGIQTFISGMARGVDIWAAEIVLALRDEGVPVRLIAASPFRGFEERWGEEWRARYQRVLARADLVRFICPRYSKWCFQQRNEWMVDHAARVIAVWNGQPSGTGNAVRYARVKGVEVVKLPG